MMEDKIWTKQVLAGNRLSTIFEFQEHHFAERKGNAEVSKTHQTSKATERQPGDQRQDSMRQSTTTGKFPAVLPALYSQRSTDSPLRKLPGKMLQPALLHERKIDNWEVKETSKSKNTSKLG